MNSSKIFRNTWALQQLPIGMQLMSIEWRFLICSDGKTPVDSIQKRLGITPEEGDVIVRHLCSAGLLTETSLTLEDFARATVDKAHPTKEAQTLPEYLASAESNGTTRPSAAAAVPEKNEKPIPQFSPLQKPTQSPMPMSLQAVIQFILNQNSSDPTAGHFATYQVFMGIGTPLLKRNGITSLRFQEDRIITDPELQGAIIESLQKVLKVTCTPEMLSPAAAAAHKN